MGRCFVFQLGLQLVKRARCRLQRAQAAAVPAGLGACGCAAVSRHVCQQLVGVWSAIFATPRAQLAGSWLAAAAANMGQQLAHPSPRQANAAICPTRGCHLQTPKGLRSARFDVVFMDETMRITRGDRVSSPSAGGATWGGGRACEQHVNCCSQRLTQSMHSQCVLCSGALPAGLAVDGHLLDCPPNYIACVVMLLLYAGRAARVPEGRSVRCLRKLRHQPPSRLGKAAARVTNQPERQRLLKHRLVALYLLALPVPLLMLCNSCRCDPLCMNPPVERTFDAMHHRSGRSQAGSSWSLCWQCCPRWQVILRLYRSHPVIFARHGGHLGVVGRPAPGRG